jgi:hypothetical protein
MVVLYVVLYADSGQHASLVATLIPRDGCRQLNGRSLLPSLLVVTRGLSWEIIVTFRRPHTSSYTGLPKANHDYSRECHRASSTILHRISDRSTQRNEILLPPS